MLDKNTTSIYFSNMGKGNENSRILIKFWVLDTRWHWLAISVFLCLCLSLSLSLLFLASKPSTSVNVFYCQLVNWREEKYKGYLLMMFNKIEVLLVENWTHFVIQLLAKLFSLLSYICTVKSRK